MIQQTFAEYLDRLAAWRLRVGLLFPDDPRNGQSSQALSELAQFVRSLPSGDSRLRRLESLFGTDWRTGERLISGIAVGPQAELSFKRYGFGAEEEPGAFLYDMVVVAEAEWRELARGVSQAPPARKQAGNRIVERA